MQPTINTAAHSAESTLGHWVQTRIARFNAWRSYRKTVASLSVLSDHELSDIGLTRSEIHSVARLGR